jgi:hypothetical protein
VPCPRSIAYGRSLVLLTMWAVGAKSPKHFGTLRQYSSIAATGSIEDYSQFIQTASKPAKRWNE